MSAAGPASSGRSPARGLQRAVAGAALEVVLGLVALLLSALVTAHTLAAARVTSRLPVPDGGGDLSRHDWHTGLLVLAAAGTLGTGLAAAGLVLGMRALRRGRRTAPAARTLPLAALLLALAVLVLATWTRAQLGTS